MSHRYGNKGRHGSMSTVIGFFVGLFWIIVAIIVVKYIAANPDSGTTIGNSIQGLFTWVTNIVTGAIS